MSTIPEDDFPSRTAVGRVLLFVFFYFSFDFGLGLSCDSLRASDVFIETRADFGFAVGFRVVLDSFPDMLLNS